MKESTYQAFEALRKALQEDPRVKRLNALEEEVNQSEELAALSQEMKKKAEAYQNSLYFGQDDPNKTPPAQHELYLAKKKLDENPLAMEYQKAYWEVRRLYAELDGILFGDFRVEERCGGKHHA